jgi:hypothetical protein
MKKDDPTEKDPGRKAGDQTVIVWQRSQPQQRMLRSLVQRAADSATDSPLVIRDEDCGYTGPYPDWYTG